MKPFKVNLLNQFESNCPEIITYMYFQIKYDSTALNEKKPFTRFSHLWNYISLQPFCLYFYVVL